MLALEALLTPFGFDPTRPTKLVRHQDQRYDVQALYRADQFEYYQSIQRRPVLAGCEQIVSFFGRAGTHASFIGVYQVAGVQGPSAHPIPEGFLYPEMRKQEHYRYELHKDDRFDDLHGRLVIDWGAGTRSWVQNFRPGGKAVIEVLPKGFVRPFPGFLDILLRHDELVDIVNSPAAHRDWHQMLKSMAGIYLILDSATGNQYVGSAYGESGLLGRWTTYAKNGHGGNAQLQALLKASPEAVRGFQFSVLQTLPITLTPKEVIAYEGLHKRKLGTRAHGLNSN